MFKQALICAALVAWGTDPLQAQQREAVIQKIEITGADFSILLAKPKTQRDAVMDLYQSPDALLIHLIGGKLTLAFDDETKMIKTLDLLRSPVGSFQVNNKDGNGLMPIAVYVTRNEE